MRKALILLMILGSLFSFSEMKARQYISPHHPDIRYSGRIDTSSKDTVRFDWPGISIGCRFSGKSIGIRINGGNGNHFNLFIDGELTSVFQTPRDTIITIHPLQRNKTHDLLLTKRTEASMGITRFIAHSGKGLVRNYGDEKSVSDVHDTMPGRFNRTLDSDSAQTWDSGSWKPDCVVINLGTNDFSTTPHPDKFAFWKGYKELISKIRYVYGHVPVFCVVGPMIDEPCFSYVKEFTLYCQITEQDKQVYFAGLPDNLLNETDDLGSDWNPSYKGQLKIAKQLLVPIATVINWDYQNNELIQVEEGK